MTDSPQIFHIQLRLKAGKTSEGDLTLSVQPNTFEYLKNTDSPEISISAYLDRDLPSVVTKYEEVYVEENRVFRVLRIAAGSRTRKVILPGEMKDGEQITIQVRQ